MIHIVTLKLPLMQHFLQTILIILFDNPHTLAYWLWMKPSYRTAISVRGWPRRMIQIICKKDNGGERQNFLFYGSGQVKILSNCPLCNKPVQEEGSKHSQKGLSCQTYTHCFPKGGVAEGSPFLKCVVSIYVAQIALDPPSVCPTGTMEPFFRTLFLSSVFWPEKGSKGLSPQGDSYIGGSSYSEISGFCKWKTSINVNFYLHY